MRVLHLVPSMTRDADGVSRVVYAMAQEQQAKMLEVFVFYGFLDGGNPSIFSDRIFHKRGFQTYFGGFAFVPDLISSIVELRPDVIHCHSLWNFFSLAAYLASKKLGKPFILSSHGMLTEYAFNWHKIKKQILLFLFQRKVIEKCAALFCFESEKEIVEGEKLCKNFIIIPNGVSSPITTCHTNSDIVTQKHPNVKEKKTLLFLGQVHPRKGLKIFLEAYSQIHERWPEWHFLIVGPSKLNHKEELINYAKKKSLMESVTFCEGVSDGEKWGYLCGADLFVLTSYGEGFSVAVLESLAAGVPVLISDKCFFNEVLEANAGKVCQLTIKSILESLELLFSLSPDELSHMGQNGKKLISQKYLWRQIISRVIFEYECVNLKVTRKQPE